MLASKSRMFRFQRTGEQFPKICPVYSIQDKDLVELVDYEDYYFVDDLMIAHWSDPPRFPNKFHCGVFLTDIGYAKFKDDFQSSLYEYFRKNQTKNKSFFSFIQKVENELEEFWDEVMKSTEENKIQLEKENGR